MKTVAIDRLLLLGVLSLATVPALAQSLPKLPGGKPHNIVLIVADDHRHDALGCAGHPFLKTPHLDALAKGGAHLRNAFVTTVALFAVAGVDSHRPLHPPAPRRR